MTAPTTLQIGTGFLAQVGGRAPKEMHLISLPSMTHAFNMDQRMVQLNDSILERSVNDIGRV